VNVLSLTIASALIEFRESAALRAALSLNSITQTKKFLKSVALQRFLKISWFGFERKTL
jgi:hypothetical protein